MKWSEELSVPMTKTASHTEVNLITIMKLNITQRLLSMQPKKMQGKEHRRGGSSSQLTTVFMRGLCLGNFFVGILDCF